LKQFIPQRFRKIPYLQQAIPDLRHHTSSIDLFIQNEEGRDVKLKDGLSLFHLFHEEQPNRVTLTMHERSPDDTPVDIAFQLPPYEPVPDDMDAREVSRERCISSSEFPYNISFKGVFLPITWNTPS
jgi:hypothetical protein